MPTFLDQKSAADALWNGMGPMQSPATPIPPVPPQGPSDKEMDAIFEKYVRPKLDTVAKGMPWELGGGAYDDGPTTAQYFRDKDRLSEAYSAQDTPQTVRPPETLTDDNIAGRVVHPNQVMDPTFNPSAYMPTSYGAGKYKMYTPAMSDVLKTMKPSPAPPPEAVQKLLDALKGPK